MGQIERDFLDSIQVQLDETTVVLNDAKMVQERLQRAGVHKPRLAVKIRELESQQARLRSLLGT